MNQIELKKLDKLKWQTFRFEEIAKSITERIDPNNTDLKVYIGLEHLDRETVHIKRFGTPNDVKGQKLKCYPGDVIFGKRRAYQRKAGIVTKVGFCSAHSMVLRPNLSVIDPRFFPFFLHSDLFMHTAVDISVGSLSPTINWTTLKKQEFLLPSLKNQADFAELYWSMDDTLEWKRKTFESLNRLKYINAVHSFNNGIETSRVAKIQLPNKSWKLRKIKEIIPDIEYGISISIPKNIDPKGVPIVSTAEISKEGELNYSIIRSINYGKCLNKRLILKDNDVLFNWRNSIELIGKSTIFNQPKGDIREFTFASFILRLRCDEKNAHCHFFKHLLNYYRDVGVFVGLARKAVNQANFNKNEVLELLVPVPSFKEQKEIADKINLMDEMRDQFKENINSSKNLLNKIINETIS